MTLARHSVLPSCFIEKESTCLRYSIDTDKQIPTMEQAGARDRDGVDAGQPEEGPSTAPLGKRAGDRCWEAHPLSAYDSLALVSIGTSPPLGSGSSLYPGLTGR